MSLQRKAVLTRRKSSTSAASASSENEGFTIYDRSSTTLTTMDQQQQQPEEQQQKQQSILSTLFSPLSSMDIISTLPTRQVPRVSAIDPLGCGGDGDSDDNSQEGGGFQMINVTTSTTTVVAEECSSDDGSDEEEEYNALLSLDQDEENDSSTSIMSGLMMSKHHQQQAQQQQSQLVVVDRPGFRKRLALIRAKRQRQPRQEMDVQAYMSKREMTANQERWNAITVIPNPIFCMYFLLGGLWVSTELVERVRQEMMSASGDSSLDVVVTSTATGFAGFANDMLGDYHGCLNNSTSSWWHNMPALPPLPAMAVALGITLHAPFSVLYHWKYAHSLPAGAPRTRHWSRRMDQSMIHVASALIAYGTSGSWDFFVANVLYNADCVYRQFHDKVRPRRNKVRLLISVICYTMPIVCRKSAQAEDVALFGQLWCVLLVSFWLFGLYPIGGWSHAAFHLVAMFIPPLLMTAACRLPVAQEQMKLAAQCVVLAEHQAATSVLQ